jgi:hypothetical protein
MIGQHWSCLVTMIRFAKRQNITFVNKNISK